MNYLLVFGTKSLMHDFIISYIGHRSLFMFYLVTVIFCFDVSILSTCSNVSSASLKRFDKLYYKRCHVVNKYLNQSS